MPPLKPLIMIELMLTLGLLIYRQALAAEHRKLVGPKVVILVLLTPIIAATCRNVFLLYAYLVAAVALVGRSRREVVCIYAVMLPMIPELKTEPRLGSVYLTTLSTYFMMSLGAAIGIMLHKPQQRVPRLGHDLAAAALVLLFVFMNERDTTATSMLRGMLTQLVVLGFPYLIMSRGILRHEDMQDVLLSLGLAATVAAVVAAFEISKGWPLYRILDTALQLPLDLRQAVSYRGGRLRAPGPLEDYTALGLFLAVGFVVLTQCRQIFSRQGFGIVLAIVLLGLLASQSRGAWTAAFVGAVLVALARGRRALALGGGALAFAFYGLVQVAGTQSRLGQVLGQSGDAADTADYRRALFERGLEQVRLHPFVGQTPEQLRVRLLDLEQGQKIVDFVNTHLFVAMSTGIPGFLIWTLVWVGVGLSLWRAATPRAGPSYAAPVLGLVVVPMIALLFTSPIDRNLTWAVIGLGLAGAAVRLERARDDQARAERRRPAAPGPAPVHPAVA